MSSDSFKSSTLGPEALAARLELEKRQREERQKNREADERAEARRESALQFAFENSKTYESATEDKPAPIIPKLSRAENGISAVENSQFSITSKSATQKDSNKQTLYRFRW